ncbi:MAG: B12-binding domain-containing protein [Granulosicoccus sp.]
MATTPGDLKVGAEHQAEIVLTEEIKASGTAKSPSQIELLLKTVESELIPRLFVNHMMDVPSSSPLVENRSTEPVPGPWSSDDNIAAFSSMCISNDPEKLDQHVTDLLAQGVTLESIFLFLLAPAAKHLGECWVSDDLSFVDVHLGLCRLHQLICECETIGYRSESLLLAGESILLSCAPGENHTFGVTMVADFFRRYGWQVSNLCGLDSDFLIARVASTHYTAVGFSLHNEYNYSALENIIRQVKGESCNKDLFVMVGGDYFIRNPNKVESIGAEVFASDGRQAVLKATQASKKRDRPVL